MSDRNSADSDDTLSPNADDLLYGQLADAINACLQSGQTPDVAALAVRFSSLAREIPDLVAKLTLLRQLRSENALLVVPPSGGPPQGGTTNTAERIGDFQLVREIGRGGMGLVFEAQQISLKRRVALKLLPLAAMLDPRRLQRFEREAQAAAHLHHTNIVPVFAVGCEGGRPYYAMQYIEGHTLAAVIDELRRAEGLPIGNCRTNAVGLTSFTDGSVSGDAATQTPPEPYALASTLPSIRGGVFFQRVAELGRQAAAALDHAHQEGVIHRDVKPANLMVDTSGQLWITDFGLARLASEAGATLSGDLVGTLRYMCPEQALAQRGLVDHRADIYSLGATLYELLTLEPVFSGEDRQELLRKIAFEEPRPMRRINRFVPVELETIVMKALAKTPAERYATAKELADDLGRYLKHEPIQARPPSIPDRIIKWVRRHPAAAVAVMAVLFNLVTALAVYTVVVRSERDDADAQRQDAVHARDAAETQRKSAVQARTEAEDRRRDNFLLTDLLSNGLVEWMSEEPARIQYARPLLEKVQAMQEQLVQKHGEDFETRLQQANVNCRKGDLQSLLKERTAAEQSYRQAIAILHQLDPSGPAGSKCPEHWAVAYNQLGLVFPETRKLEAVDAFRHAVAYLEALDADQRAVPRVRGHLGAIRSNLAMAYHAVGRNAEAEQQFQLALELLQSLPPRDASCDPFRKSLVALHTNRGIQQWQTSRTEAALASFKSALEAYNLLPPEQQMSAEGRRLRCDVLSNLGLLLTLSGRHKEGEPYLIEAEDLIHHLASVYPTYPAYRFLWGKISGQLGLNHSGQHRHEKAMELFRQSKDALVTVVRESPQEVTPRRELANAYQYFMEQLARHGHLDEAKEAYRLGVDVRTQLVAQFPKDADELWYLIDSSDRLGTYLCDAGRTKETAEFYERMRTQLVQLEKDFPAPARRQRLARFLVDCPNPAFRNPQQALDLLEKAVEPAARDGIDSLILGIAHYRTGDCQAAVGHLEKALAKLDGDSAAECKFFLAMANYRLDRLDHVHEWYAAGLAWIDGLPESTPEWRRLRAEAAALLGVEQPAKSKKK